MNKIGKVSFLNIIGLICLMIGAGVLFRTAALFVSGDIWFDELFTVEFMSKPIAQMLPLASKDVHPPLYYIYARLVYLCMDVIKPGVDVVIAAKWASLIPYFGLMIYLICFVKKRFGFAAASLSFLLITCMPQMPQYMAEARMYSLALFTVFAMFVHMMEYICELCKPYSDASKESTGNITNELCKPNKANYVNLVLATLFCIISMYLHYYSFIAAGAIWMCTFGYLIYRIARNGREKKAGCPQADWGHDECLMQPRGIHADTVPDKKMITRALLCVCICIVFSLLAYIPWLSSVMSQVSAVSSSYWIQPVSLRTIGGCIKYIFKPEFENGLVNIIFACICFGSYLFFFFRYVYVCLREKKTFELIYVCFALATFVILVAAGFALSILIKPIFVYRYMLPAMGLFWLVFAIVFTDFIQSTISEISENACFLLGTFCKSLTIVILSILLFMTMNRDYNMFKWEEQKKISGMQTSEETFDMIENAYADSVLVCNFNQVQAILWHYLDNESILWGETDELLVAEVCKRDAISMTDNLDTLAELTQTSVVDGDRGFLFVGSGNARDDIIDYWEQNKMSVELIADSCLVERYYFNIYKVNW